MAEVESESSAAVSEAPATLADERSVTEPETSGQNVPTAAAQAPSAERPKKKKQSEDEKCAAAMGKYFASRAAQISSAAAVTVQPRTADDSFCAMLADEIKNIQSPSIKRDLKRNILDAVYAAQAQEEQLALINTNILVLHDPGDASQFAVPAPATITAEQVPSSGETAEGAQVLLQLAQQPP